VRPSASLAELRAALGGPLPAGPLPPERVVAELIAAAEPGIMASSSGRFFGFVVGGATPAALAADWLTSAWDQNAGLYVLGPAASVVEETAATWLLDVLGLPARASVGSVTGGQMANFTALAIAVREVLRRVHAFLRAVAADGGMTRRGCEVGWHGRGIASEPRLEPAVARAAGRWIRGIALLVRDQDRVAAFR
jgi:hypothetical protein